jgi:hypothetical protein
MPAPPGGPRATTIPVDLFERPATALFIGPPGPLLNLVVFGFASTLDPGVAWVDVRNEEEEAPSLDPGRLGLVRPDRYRTASPEVLIPNPRALEVDTSPWIRPEEATEAVQNLKGFMGLSAHTQETISQTIAGKRPPVIVLSNAHRISRFYPEESLGVFLDVFKKAGITLFLAYQDTPPASRLKFDYVFHLDGHDAADWRSAALNCEQGVKSGPLAVGKQCPLASIAPVARALEKALGTPRGE